MDKNKIINLEKEIKKQQRTVKEFTQSDVNDLTVEGMQHLMQTMNGINKNIGVLFDFVKLAADTAKQNQERIEALEKKIK